ncbi:MAG: permease [Bacteroidia bacterium]|nr:MAG: permease [Bacteroidia bacterium]
MFLGHFAVALAAKKAAPKVSLGTMILSTSFIDLLWPLFLILGLEHVRVVPGITVVAPLDFYDYPLTHSLLATMGWSLLVGGAYWMLKKNRRGAIIVGLGVLSHWILDFIVHRPDLPLLPGSDTRVGLGLWNSLAGTLVLEGVLFIGGVFLFRRATKSTNRAGTVSFWSLVVFLIIVSLANIFGPPPPDTSALGYVGLSMWLLVAWGYWIDRNRSSGEAPLP